MKWVTIVPGRSWPEKNPNNMVGNSNLDQTAAKALGQIGDVRAVRPLLALAGDTFASSAAVWALQNILERSVERITPEELRAVASLKNVIQGWVLYSIRGSDYGEQTVTEEEQVDCTYVQQLAQQELIRRGLDE